MLTKKLKGFTLIELMIVIAVIALLMIVLLPRIGIIKNKARESGIKENLLLVEGVVQSVIDEYDAGDASAVTDLETRIANDIDRANVTNQRIRNPVTGGTDVTDINGASVTDTTAVAYDSLNDNTDDGADVGTVWTDGMANAAGIVAFCAYVDTTSSPNKLCVELVPYGVDNDKMSDLRKVISQ